MIRTPLSRFGAKPLVILSFILFSASCASVSSPIKKENGETNIGEVVSATTDEDQDELEAEVEAGSEIEALPSAAPAIAEVTSPEQKAELDAEIKAADAKIEPLPHTEVPLEMNENVQKWIHYFSVKDRARFERFLTRGAFYKDVVTEILDENDVPQELYYLAMIESGYATNATSRARAVGVWQFMRKTGHQYGLKSDRFVDERRDVMLATRAAAKHLKYLHDEFGGSWYLALAAYNAGEGRIGKAIKKGNSKDFWKLANEGFLPRETIDYVPKFMAAVIVGSNPSKYGFNDLKTTKLPEVKQVKVPGSVPLREIAKAAQLPVQHLQQLNPSLVKAVTPPGTRHWSVWVPVEKAQLVAKARKKLVQVKIPRVVTRVHRVKYGETLQSIARKYGLSLRELKKINRLRSDRLVKGQSLRIHMSV